ncbi:hypothetical protein L1987_65193 [Smallanthus sonchifolius]|uniref:Uncharacterized protein n=1 Tax=Smallanthus sonchifolius TaxID=185202 RepID=A0ACB9BTR3_9ASTR|nr:hypothetical protein L1987_65193 [Smallanthus sonchifolius]
MTKIEQEHTKLNLKIVRNRLRESSTKPTERNQLWFFYFNKVSPADDFVEYDDGLGLGLLKMRSLMQGSAKHKTGNKSLLNNFTEKFGCWVKFRNRNKEDQWGTVPSPMKISP